MEKYIDENKNFDYSNDAIQNLLTEIDANYSKLSEMEFAIKAYNFVRDKWLYSPDRISLIESDFVASKITTRKSGHCIDKAIIYISLLRSQKIPARLGLAKVKNHIVVEGLMEKLGNDVLVPHGYVEVFLQHKWVKATPAFNKSLCEILNVDVLDFDGENDSIFQEFDKSGNKNFMEYLEDYGSFTDVPLDYIFDLMTKTYPEISKKGIKLGQVVDLSKL